VVIKNTWSSPQKDWTIDLFHIPALLHSRNVAATACVAGEAAAGMDQGSAGAGEQRRHEQMTILLFSLMINVREIERC